MQSRASKDIVGEQLSLFGLKATEFERDDPMQLMIDIREIAERPKQLGRNQR